MNFKSFPVISVQAVPHYPHPADHAGYLRVTNSKLCRHSEYKKNPTLSACGATCLSGLLGVLVKVSRLMRNKPVFKLQLEAAAGL